MPHVFVTPGDITRFASDAWLLPTDRTLHVTDGWCASIPGLRAAVQALRDHEGGGWSEDQFSFVLPGWAEDRPQPVLVTVPLRGVGSVAEVRDPLEHGLRTAAVAAHERVSLRRESALRGLPLVATPLFAAAGGGADSLRGDLIRTVLDIARTVAAAQEVDVALVLRERADLAHAQAIRRSDPTAWAELGSDLVDEATALAGEARAGRLVPFIGAGVSATAGLPMWGDLLSALADGRIAPAHRAEFDSLGPLDRAHVLRERYLSADGLNAAVVAQTTSHVYGLAPALLAGLGAREAVTLNYDDLYEQAASVLDHSRPAVLPQEVVSEGGRWLLKLHGSIEDPASIVLTRDDYLGYRHGREALSALAKAMLLTRHLLFVGFGLSDDHFHELMHDVRAVLPAPAGRRLGTALMLSTSDLQREIWEPDLRLVDVRGADGPARARRLEIFLDCLLGHTDRGLPHFMDERYQQRLSPAERRLSDRLVALVAATDQDERDTPAWKEIAALLEGLGHR